MSVWMVQISTPQQSSSKQHHCHYCPPSFSFISTCQYIISNCSYSCDRIFMKAYFIRPKLWENYIFFTFDKRRNDVQVTHIHLWIRRSEASIKYELYILISLPASIYNPVHICGKIFHRVINDTIYFLDLFLDILNCIIFCWVSWGRWAVLRLL